ncbi:zinc-binding alcohol dehydrogenase family protein [Lichenicoccus sp.]|uniref:zinc-binding alcohol dehydrogenase family protein n=1 Tax=Lichenicoccus sp. TaxID=2781899 RepID=UPI003D0C173C
MRALLCEAPGRLAVVQRPDPVPRADEAVLRIRRVGVCGTDLHIYEGKHPFLHYPRVMGHELAGEVVHAPPGSTLRPGKAAYVVPYLSCGHCRACRRGRTNCCRNISVLGVHQDGGMAELLAVPASNVVPLDGIGLDEAAMVEFLAIGAHGIARGAVTAQDRVLVVGAGPIGIAAILFARARGAPVSVVDMRQDRLDLALASLGADAGLLANADTEAALSEATGGEFFDVVVDATGNVGSIRNGLRYVGHGGRYVLLSVVREEIGFPDPAFHARETTLLASRNALPEDFTEVVTRMREGSIPVAALRTHHARLDDAAAQFPGWLRPEAGVIKATIEV